MAKQRGPLRLQGKHGDVIFTKTKFGYKTRQAPTLSEEVRKERSERPQNRRTDSLNKFAGTIVRGLRMHAPMLINGRIYSNLQSFFKSEQTLELPILLDKIKREEIRKDHPFSGMYSTPAIDVTTTKTSYQVGLTINSAPVLTSGSNCFFAQIILLVWRGDLTECISMEGSTEWMRLNEKFPQSVIMEFPKTAKDTDYLLASRYAGGVNDHEDNIVAGQAIHFFGAGTLTKRGRKILDEYKAAVQAEEEAKGGVPETDTKVRWKMKKE